ncbi:MAG: hypothetical protein VB031_05930 [Eubacteriaceae bacterium]|nr:hypothetical protein [Eubacteriaceae bacterium]
MDAAFAGGCLAASAGAGAIMGVWLGPVGLVVGGIVGAAAYAFATDGGIKYKGKSIKDNSKEYVSRAFSIG